MTDQRKPNTVAVPPCRDHYDCEACSAYTDSLYARIDAVTLERDLVKRQRDALAKVATGLADIVAQIGEGK